MRRVDQTPGFGVHRRDEHIAVVSVQMKRSVKGPVFNIIITIKHHVLTGVERDIRQRPSVWPVEAVGEIMITQVDGRVACVVQFYPIGIPAGFVLHEAVVERHGFVNHQAIAE